MKSGPVSIEGKLFYLVGNNDGARKIGVQNIEDDIGDSYKSYFDTNDEITESHTNGVGVTGSKNGKLYGNGLLVAVDGVTKSSVVDTSKLK